MGEIQMERPPTALSNLSGVSDISTQSHIDHHQHNALQLDEVDALASLPPPPSPFPMEQLASLLAATREAQRDAVRDDDAISDSVSEADSEASDVTVSVHYDYDDMTELNLVGIQRHCVGCIEILVPPHCTKAVSDKDQELAAKLGELLEATYELETFHPSSACCSPATPASEEESDQSPFLALVHALQGAQAVVAQRQPRPFAPPPATDEPDADHPHVEIMREELAWARVESLARGIVELVRARDETESAPRTSEDVPFDVEALPPKYRRSERDSAGSSGSNASRVSGPPAYKDYSEDKSIPAATAPAPGKIDRKSQELPSSPRSTMSRIAPMLNDLDTVTHAIERLNYIAPQLDDQRIALRSPSQRKAKPKPLNLRQPGDARMRELDGIWDKIERAHGANKQAAVERVMSRESLGTKSPTARRVTSKQFMLGELPPTPGSPKVVRNTSRSRTRDDSERTTFLEELMQSSANTRMRDQDVPLRPRTKSSSVKPLSPKNNVQLEDAIDRSPGRLASQDFPIPLDQFLANKLSSTRTNFDAVSIKSSKSTTIKATKHKHRPKDLFQIVADASSGRRLSNQEVPPPTPRSRKQYLEVLTTGTKDAPPPPSPVTPRTPLSATFAATSSWLPRVGSRDTLLPPTPRTPFTPAGPWAHSPSIASPGTPTSPAFPPSLYEEPASPRPAQSTSIRKIMGQLVRRGSSSNLAASSSSNTSKDKTPNATPKSKPLQLPPMPPPPIDPEAVGYVCEHQENLRTVQVMLYGGDTALATDLELEVATPGDAVVTSRSDSKLRITVALPTPVPLGQRVPFTTADGHVEAKLAALPTPSSALSLNSNITHALSAPNLRQLAPRSLCCTQCDHELAEFPADVQFKDLPSEHWAEMLEAWMCHADPTFTAHIAKQTKDGFWPTKNTVLVGGSYLLVAGSDICWDKLVKQDASETDDWRLVSCPCGEVLGKVRQDGLSGEGTVRFSKWAISLMRGRGGGDIEHIRFPVSCFIVSDMLELSQAHASYRFIIADEASGAPRLALWLFNPSMHVAYRRPAKATFSLTSAPAARGRSSSERPGRLGMRSSGDRPRGMRSSSSTRAHASEHAPARSLRGAKIMFKLLDGADRGTEGLPGFGGQVETMRYPRDVCDNLIAALRNSTSVYPASRRSLGAFSAGFLERV